MSTTQAKLDAFDAQPATETETDGDAAADARTPGTYAGSEAFGQLREGDVIRVPQYTNALRVSFVGDFMVGVEFTDRTTTASKHLIQNEHSGRAYLVAGSTDKGEVEEYELVAARDGEGDR